MHGYAAQQVWLCSSQLHEGQWSTWPLHCCCAGQVIDPHTHEYMARLRDEPVFLALCQKVHDYFGRIGDTRK